MGGEDFDYAFKISDNRDGRPGGSVLECVNRGFANTYCTQRFDYLIH